MSDRSVRVVLTAVTSQYQAAMAKATASTKALGTQMAAGAKNNAQLDAALGRFGLNTKTVMGGAVAGSLLYASKAAIDFESSFAGIRKTVDGTEAEFQAIAQGMRDMSKEIPVSVNELNAIGEMAGQLGIQKENILGFTETIAKLGETTNLAGQEAAASLAKFANITQMPEQNFDRLGATIVALGNAGASTEADIAAFGLRIAGAGEIAGLTEAEILGIANAMTSVTDDLESGGTAVQKVLLSITDSVNSADDKLAVFAETAGMTASEFQSAWRDDPASAFAAFVEGLGEAGQGATGILKTLNLDNERTRKAFLSLAGAGNKLWDSLNLGRQSYEENAALNEEFGKRVETTESQLKLAKNSVDDLAISFGQQLMPAIEDTAQGVAKLANLINELFGLVDKLPGFMQDVFSGGPLGFLKDFGEFNTNDFLTLGMSRILPDSWTDWIPHFEVNPFDWFGGDGPSEEELAAALDHLRSAGAGAAEGIGSAFESVTGSLDPLISKIEDAEAAYESLNATISGASSFLDIESAAIDVDNAMLDLKDSQAAVNQLVDDGKKGTREYKRAILDLRANELNVISTQADLEESLLSYTEKVKTGEISQRKAIDAVKAFGAAGQLTKEQVNDLIDRIKGYDSTLEGLPDKKKTRIEADGLTEAQRAVQLWKNSLEQIPSSVTTTVRVATVGAGPLGNKALVQHAGGPAGHGSSRYSTGRVHMRADEYPTIVQRGEVVLSKAQVKAMASSSGNIIYVDARGSVLTEGQITRAVQVGIDQSDHRKARASRWQTSVAT